jgi:hypothetical protein
VPYSTAEFAPPRGSMVFGRFPRDLPVMPDSWLLAQDDVIANACETVCRATKNCFRIMFGAIRFADVRMLRMAKLGREIN